MPPVVDPNFLTNAFAQGMQLGFNYGPQAQEDRSSVISARNLQADYNYGTGAREYRETQREGLEAQTRGIDARTGYQSLLNEAQSLQNTQARLAEEQLGDLTRGLVSTNLKNSLVDANRLLKLNNDPIYDMAVQGISSLRAQVAFKEMEFGFANVENENRRRTAEIQTGITRAEQESFEAKNQFDLEQRKQKLQRSIDAGRELDARSGANTFDNEIAALGLAMQSDIGAFSQNTPMILSRINAIEKQGTVKPEQAQILNMAKAQAGWIQANDQVGNVFRQAAVNAETGQGREEDSAVTDALNLLAVDPSDPETYRSVQIDELNNGEVVLNNVGLGLKSPPLTRAQFQSSPMFHKLRKATTARGLHQGNPILAREAVKEQLRGIATKPLGPQSSFVVSKLMENIPTAFKSPGAITKLADIQYQVQQDQLTYNPFYQPAFLAAQEGTLLDNNQKRFENLDKLVNENPAIRQQVRDAWNNRFTGGMPPELYEYRIQQMIDVAKSEDPASFGPQNPPHIIKMNTDRLRNAIKAHWKLAMPTDLPHSLKVAAGLEDIKPSDSTRTYMGQTMLGIKQFFYGEKINDYLVIGDQTLDSLPSEEQEYSDAPESTFADDAAYAFAGPRLAPYLGLKPPGS